MKIVPFVQVGDLLFGASQAVLISAFGEPISRRAGRESLQEFSYTSALFRFDAGDALVEATVNVPFVDLGERCIPFALLRDYISARDASAFETAGFVVSPRFGIAFDPECPSWVTAFPRESIELWRALGARGAGA